jgi:hypothetical protein
MAKKQMNEESQGETMNSEVEGVEPNSVESTKEKVSNIVELSNGERVNFGKNGKIVATYDVDSKVVTFKLVTGEILTLDISEIPENVLAEAAIYGVREKIKATLAPTPAAELSSKISKEFEALKEGKFVTRSSDTGTVELDDFMKAFALVNATGVVNTGNGVFTVSPNTDKVSFIIAQPLKSHWVNVEDTAVISEVLAFWDALSTKEKTAQRKNTFIKTQASLLAALKS